MAARLQESRAEAGVVAAPRTEAQRMAVRDNCAERPRGWLCGTTVQRGPEDGCVNRGAQRMAVWDDCAERPRGHLCGTAVQAEGPRGRDWLAACRLTLSEWDFSD